MTDDRNQEIDAWLDGELSTAAGMELEAWFRADASRMEAFVEAGLLHRGLREALLTQPPPLFVGNEPVKVAAADVPIGGLFGNATGGAVGYLSSGWPVAYLVATVISGIALVIGSLTPVSQPAQVAKQTVLPSTFGRGARGEGSENATHSRPVVGRITGMVDCRWEGKTGDSLPLCEAPEGPFRQRETVPLFPVVTLGDQFALASGLMEITYDTGAKVILQGPVTYEVESAASGYLSVGRLTARVEGSTKYGVRRTETANSGQWPVASDNQQSTINNQQSSNPQSLIPNPLFAVRTPTAIVTDLGTEFGVEVNRSGVTETHVFSGTVIAKGIDREGRIVSSQTLLAGKAVAIEGGRMETIVRAARSDRFVRSFPRPQPMQPMVKFLGPMPYQSFENRAATPNISPFSKAAGGPFGPLVGGKGNRHWTGPAGKYFYLEDAESGAIRAPGLSIAGGRVIGVTDTQAGADSVDEDDGTIDNATNGALSHSIYCERGKNLLTIGFDAVVLGRLPTHVGFVLTDCNPAFNTIVEAFDAAHHSLGKTVLYNSSFSPGIYTSGPNMAEKARFIGMVCARGSQPPGIGSVVVTEVAPNGRAPEGDESAGFEVDHVQYGFLPPLADAPADADANHTESGQR